MDWLFERWDGAELWLVQLPYPLLTAIFLGVLVPVCWGVARLVDRAIDTLAARLTTVRDAEPPVSRSDRRA